MFDITIRYNHFIKILRFPTQISILISPFDVFLTTHNQ